MRKGGGSNGRVAGDSGCPKNQRAPTVCVASARGWPRRAEPPRAVRNCNATVCLLGTSTEQFFLISAKTSLFFSFYGGSWSFMLSLSIIYACFYACCVEFFVLSIITVSPKEHPGLGAASARRHRTFLRARGRGTGEASGGVSGG